MKVIVSHSVLWVMLFGLMHVQAQDVHFSQYYFSPLSLNPANTGNYKGDFRFFGNYRSQWRDINDAYETYSAGGDFNIYPGNVNLSGGLMVLNDQSAINLGVTKIMPSMAWHFKAAGYRFHVGVQPSAVINSFNFYANSFPDQFNMTTGGFDKKLPNSEVNNRQNFTYFDLNSGFVVSRRFNKIEPEIGYALFHMNEPKQSFFNNSKNFLHMRHATNVALSYYVNEKVIIKAYTLYGVTRSVSDWVSGINYEYILARTPFYSNSVFAGFMWRSGINRNSDAGIVTAGLNYKNWTLGFSYDITFSPLKTSVNSKGAYEIAFIVRGKNTRLTQKVLPCERY
jgi:type IX secretion system PorP/SprF family membrane protein